MKTKWLTFKNTRDVRYCEFFVVKAGSLEMYNTMAVSDCPAQLFDSLDLEKIKKQYDATVAQKSGPRYWMMDTNSALWGEQKFSFGGIDARWVARTDPSALAGGGTAPYKVWISKKTNTMLYSKGKPVFELVDPEGNAYVMQSRVVPIDSLAKLGEKLALPAGWKFRTRTLTENLVLVLTPDKPIYVVADELHQYYTRIPKAK